MKLLPDMFEPSFKLVWLNYTYELSALELGVYIYLVYAVLNVDYEVWLVIPLYVYFYKSPSKLKLLSFILSLFYLMI